MFCATLWCSINRYLDFLKVFFCPGWLCHFKGLFIPVWREIHRSKILPVTSWQLPNRKVSDNSRRYRHSICQSFFPAWNYNIIKIHSGETSRPRDFVARSVAVRPHALKLFSLPNPLVQPLRWHHVRCEWTSSSSMPLLFRVNITKSHFTIDWLSHLPFIIFFDFSTSFSRHHNFFSSVKSTEL